MPVLQARGVTKTVGAGRAAKSVLDDVSIDVHAGEVCWAGRGAAQQTSITDRPSSAAQGSAVTPDPLVRRSWDPSTKDQEMTNSQGSKSEATIRSALEQARRLSTSDDRYSTAWSHAAAHVGDLSVLALVLPTTR